MKVIAAIIVALLVPRPALAETVSCLTPSPALTVLASPSPTPSPSPTLAPGPTAGDLWINEVMANPLGTDTGNEWIELFNRTDAPLTLTNVTIKRLSGTTLGTVPFGLVIGPESYLKVAATSSVINSGDTLVLSAGTIELDRISYDGAGKEGASWSRLSEGEGVWTDQPTPGAPNVIPESGPAADPGSLIDPPAGTGSVATTAVSSKAATIKKATTASTKKAAAKPAATAKKLPTSGPNPWVYLIPFLIAAVYWYRKVI